MKLVDIMEVAYSIRAILIIVLAIYMIRRFMKLLYEINGYWQYFFDDFSYSSETFYDDITAIVSEKEMPDVEMKVITHFETNIFSPRRQYLRISREKDVFLLCAAPFANGFFISSRKGSFPDFWHKLLFAIPIVGGLLVYLVYKKTYYQIDTQNMFTSAIHRIVVETVNKINESKGVRDLTEAQMQFERIGR